ncbi:MAG: SufS family cysteine desulfurase [Deltaproteobacteria bacterium]|nr:SufS family cysteine desulfurase [Deltaproteobacteria bacterium]
MTISKKYPGEPDPSAYGLPTEEELLEILGLVGEPPPHAFEAFQPAEVAVAVPEPFRQFPDAPRAKGPSDPAPLKTAALSGADPLSAPGLPSDARRGAAPPGAVAPSLEPAPPEPPLPPSALSLSEAPERRGAQGRGVQGRGVPPRAIPLLAESPAEPFGPLSPDPWGAAVASGPDVFPLAREGDRFIASFLAGLPGRHWSASPTVPSGFPEGVRQSSPSRPAAPARGGAKTLRDLLGRGRKTPETEAPRPIPYVGAVPVSALRADFPILQEKVEGGRDLVWLDNAATTQKPRAVIERLTRFYERENSNVHRGAHALAARATDAYEEAREKVARFIGAPSAANIVFVRGATEGLNLIARSYLEPRLAPGDEIILTLLEHHANIVPWQMVAAATGAKIRVAPVDATGQIVWAEFLRLFNGRTRFVSATHVSNALGTVTPVAEIVAAARARGVAVAVDGAQSVSHIPINVSALGADFFVFSGHKIYGPTGVGVVYGTSEALNDSPPYQGGGNMISDVTFAKTVYQGPPQKFEAGTGNIAGAVGLGAALDYLSQLGLENVAAYEESLLNYATAVLSSVPKLAIVGTAAAKAAVLSFVLEGHSIEEVGAKLSQAGVAARAGHHCAQPIARAFGLEGTVRVSLAFYNTAAEVDYLASVLRAIVN